MIGQPRLVQFSGSDFGTAGSVYDLTLSSLDQYGNVATQSVSDVSLAVTGSATILGGSVVDLTPQNVVRMANTKAEKVNVSITSVGSSNVEPSSRFEFEFLPGPSMIFLV